MVKLEDIGVRENILNMLDFKTFLARGIVGIPPRCSNLTADSASDSSRWWPPRLILPLARRGPLLVHIGKCVCRCCITSQSPGESSSSPATGGPSLHWSHSWEMYIKNSSRKAERERERERLCLSADGFHACQVEVEHASLICQLISVNSRLGGA